MDTTMDRDTLGAKLLPELQQIAQGMGVEGAQKLRKAGLIDAIVAASTNGGDPKPTRAKRNGAAKADAAPVSDEAAAATTTRARTRRPRKATGPRLATRGPRRPATTVATRIAVATRNAAPPVVVRTVTGRATRIATAIRTAAGTRIARAARIAPPIATATPTVKASSIAAAAVPRVKNAVVSARSAE